MWLAYQRYCHRCHHPAAVTVLVAAAAMCLCVDIDGLVVAKFLADVSLLLLLLLFSIFVAEAFVSNVHQRQQHEQSKQSIQRVGCTATADAVVVGACNCSWCCCRCCTVVYSDDIIGVCITIYSRGDISELRLQQQYSSSWCHCCWVGALQKHQRDTVATSNAVQSNHLRLLLLLCACT